MAVDFSALRQNDYWKKKFRRAVQVRDTNQNGFITRADFELLVNRCKKLDISTPICIERFTPYVLKLCDSFGLVDESVKLSYDEFEDKWIAAYMKESDTGKKLFGAMFRVLDIDEDGFISLEEWTAHNKVMGIDAAHARASFDAIDTNHDQKISEDEFVKYHLEYFLSTENKLNSAILYGPLQ